MTDIDTRAHERAERFVLAWLQADYEPDDVDGRWMSERSVEKLVDRVAEVYRDQLLERPYVSADSKAGRRLAQGHIVRGTPREAAPEDGDEANHRCPDCLAYTLCLAYVVEQRWRSWTCRGCAGPGVLSVKQGLAAGEAAHRTLHTRPSVQTNPDGTPWG